jgi:hypothetical protein
MNDFATISSSKVLPGTPMEFWVLRTDDTHSSASRSAVTQYMSHSQASWKVADIGHYERGEHTGVTLVNQKNLNWTMTVSPDWTLANAFRPNDIIMMAPLTSGVSRRLAISPVEQKVFFMDKVIFRDIVDPIRCTKELPLVRVHCPKVEGCETRYENTSKRSLKHDLKVSIAGIGGRSWSRGGDYQHS